MFAFLQMTLLTQKRPIGAKEIFLILALDFPSLEGVCGTLWSDDYSYFENVLNSPVHLRSYKG